MENLRRYGGTAGVILALAGAGVVWLAPDMKTYGWILSGLGALLAAVGAWLNADEFKSLLKGRPFRHGANAVFYSLLVLGVVAGIDFLAARHSHRFDLTPGGINSLSPQTVRILEGIDQDVSVVAFFLGGASARQKDADLLEEYKQRSKRLSVRIIDPQRSPAEVKAYGVEVNGTVIVSAGTGQARVTPGFSTPFNEQELSNAIIKATSTQKSVVCVSTGHGEMAIDDSERRGFQQAAEELRKQNFDVKTVRLLETGALDECSSLVVPGPSHGFLTPEVDAVRAYVSGGGRLLVMDEPQRATGLEPVLEAYGLKGGNNFVVDINPMSRLMGGSPAMPVVYDYGTHAITRDFPQGVITIFPTVESVETVTATEPNVTTEILARTTDQAWGETGPMADRVSFDQGSDKQGPLGIAAAATRKLDPAPAAADPNQTEGSGEASAGKEARVVLFGDAEYASNEALGLGANRDFFLNTVAWLNERSDLISVRPRSSAAQTLVLTALQERVSWFYNLLLFPAVLGATAVGIHLRRRRL